LANRAPLDYFHIVESPLRGRSAILNGATRSGQ
jgi:hypothetical protein